jgi:hypothetical protein
VRSSFPAVVSSLLLGCSVSASELSSSGVAVNQCEDDTSCYGGYCDLKKKTCRGLNGELTSLLLAITPGSAPGIANVTYYKQYPDDTERVNPDGGRLDIKLSPATSIDLGTVYIDTTKDCFPTFKISDQEVAVPASPAGLIPADVTFTPSQRVPGIPSDTYHAELPTLFVFQATLAPGQYDVYVRPAYPAGETAPGVAKCEVSPRLLLNQTPANEFSINLAPALELEVTVEWPLPLGVATELATPEQMLAGWTVDLIDPSSGRLLSTRVELVDPLAKGSAFWTYGAKLSYSPVYSPVKGVLQPMGVGSELVRLSPPATITAPVILAEAGGAQLFDLPAAITLASRLPEAVDVEFQTSVADVPQPVPAGVVFTAKELDNVAGISTAFSQTIQVDDKGIATTRLLPGRYRVVASPKGGCTVDSCLATTVTDWVVPASPARQAGKMIEFNQALSLAGQAFVANGGPAAGAGVRAIASSAILATDVLNSGDGRTEVLPRASSGLVGSDGLFAFEADAGIFDFRVEPDPITGYGWLVQPRVSFPATGGAISELRVPLPVVYQGTVTLDDPATPSPIPGALIRAYIFVSEDGTFSAKPVEGGAAVQVAETRADEDGNYTLLIPRVLGTER